MSGDQSTPAEEHEQAADPGSAASVSRRTLVRTLLALAVGVPAAVEGRTLLALVGRHLFGTGGGSDAAATTTVRRVGVGDELLPATAAAERLTGATLDARETAWRLTLEVTVTNDTDTPYRFRLGPVQTTGSGTAEGTASTRWLAPGEVTTLTGTWDLPAGETPDAVSATGVRELEDGTAKTSDTVHLQSVPVRGR